MHLNKAASEKICSLKVTPNCPRFQKVKDDHHSIVFVVEPNTCDFFFLHISFSLTPLRTENVTLNENSVQIKNGGKSSTALSCTKKKKKRKKNHLFV